MAAGYPPPNQPPGPPPHGHPYGHPYGGPAQGPGWPIQPYAPAPVYDPSAPYGRDPRTGLPFSDKQRLVAGLLQLLLGTFAIGRFYTGHIGLAIAQLAVVWCTCGLGIFWPIVDGIMMLTGQVTDAEGRPLRD